MTYMIDIDKGREEEFLKAIEKMGYARLVEKDRKKRAKEAVLEEIREAYNEAKLHEKGKIELKSARELLDEL